MLNKRELEFASRYSKEITEVYAKESKIPSLTTPIREQDNRAIGYEKIAKKFLMPRELFEPNHLIITRPFATFVTLSEFRYVISKLNETVENPIHRTTPPDFNIINEAISAISTLSIPDFIIIPVAFYVSLHRQIRGLGNPVIRYEPNGRSYYVGSGHRLRILWSNKFIELNEIIIGSSERNLWHYKARNNGRLKVEFMEKDNDRLVLLVETVFNFIQPPPDTISKIQFPEDLCRIRNT